MFHLLQEPLSYLLRRFSSLTLRLAWRLHQSPQEREAIRFLNVKGDKTYRLQYDLNARSVVFDLGGFEGQWASDIFAMYCCKIYVFEPIPDHAHVIERRFKRNRKIKVYRFGLSNETKQVMISLEGGKSSIFRKGTLQIKLVRASDFMEKTEVRKIDLMKINIEGAEYDLLEHLIETGLVRSIRNIQVQFHDLVPRAHDRMKTIQDRLVETHSLTYQYPFVWENWKLKEGPRQHSK